MRAFWALTKRELRASFSSPLAYVALTAFLFVCGYFFMLHFTFFIDFAARYDQIKAQNPASNVPVPNVMNMIFSGVFQVMAVVLLFVLPMVTMRLLADERRLGTLELLFTYPISDLQLVLAKFTAACCVLAAMLGATLAYPAMIALVATMPGTIVPGMLFSSYLGLMLVGMTFIAVGLFFSSLTRNQMVAGMLTFALLLVLWMVGVIKDVPDLQDVPLITGLVDNLSLADHFESFTQGLILLKDVVYFLVVIFVGVFLSFQIVQSQRWKG